MITDPQKLWQEAFGDPDSFIDSFFAKGFSPDRCMTLRQDGELAAALYWFDGYADGQKMAYIYAVATKKAFRNQGMCRRLMEKTHERLKDLGYSGAILVPGQPELFTLYEKLGYKVCCYVSEFSCLPKGSLPVEEISPEEYAVQRKKYLPKTAFLQDEKAYAFLESYVRFWKGKDWLLAASLEDECLYVQEYLGDEANAPAITAALGAKKALFRTMGTERPFAMYHPLDGSEAPAYFGLAMD